MKTRGFYGTMIGLRLFTELASGMSEDGVRVMTEEDYKVVFV